MARHEGAKGDTKFVCRKAMWLGTGVPKGRNAYVLSGRRRALEEEKNNKASCVDSHRRRQTVDALFGRST
ncbi:unnamed protein product [Prunus armeniaca]